MTISPAEFGGPPPNGPATLIVIVYWAFALAVSLFYGVNAISIFVEPHDIEIKKGKLWSWWTHEFWLNFVGCLIGWTFLWPLALKFWPCVSSQCQLGFTWKNAAAVVVAFIGITGFIPGTVIPLALGLGRLAERLGEMAALWLAGSKK